MASDVDAQQLTVFPLTAW